VNVVKNVLWLAQKSSLILHCEEARYDAYDQSYRFAQPGVQTARYCRANGKVRRVYLAITAKLVPTE